MKLAKVIQAASGNLLDTFMPGDCPGCGEPVEKGLYRRLCEWCARGIEWIRRPFCECCGSPLPGVNTVGGDCPHCRELQPSFNSGRALFLLTGTGRNFVHGVKYHGDRSLLVDLPSLMEQSPDFRDHIEGAILVPVPLHRRRLRARGYNQSAWIAEALAVSGGSDVEAHFLLKRIRNTRTQTTLSREQRMRNVKNAFALYPGKRLDGTRRYVIVDDVFTTGATLEACARVLREAGVEQVDVAALGHG